MTEAEWLTCDNFHTLLEHLRGKASGRKLRLLACALCRHIWPLITDTACKKAVEVAEQFADGLADTRELEDANAEASHATTAANKTVVWATDHPFYFQNIGEIAVCAIDAVTLFATESSFNVENEAHLSIVRDLFDNPFRAFPVCKSNLPEWNDGTVRRIAQVIYDYRAFDRMPILADALEDAGCDNADILAHCRGDGPHVRGCWVVDLLLGKS